MPRSETEAPGSKPEGESRDEEQERMPERLDEDVEIESESASGEIEPADQSG